MSREISKRAIRLEEVAPEPPRYWTRVVIGDEERSVLPGGKGWDYISPEVCGALTINAGAFEIPPGAGGGRTELHSHGQEEFSYIVRGRGLFAVEDELHRCETGDFVFVPAHARHGWINDGDEPLHVLFYRPIKAEPKDGPGSLDLRRFAIQHTE